MDLFLSGLYCRVPLWDMVFHDSTISTFGKSDANNRVEELWPYYDLLTMLQGQGPTWMINTRIYERDKEAFIKSSMSVCLFTTWRCSIGINR